MAKGSIVKNEVYNKIMEIFPNSFMYNDGKELRINTIEEGEPIQLKLVLTAAKTPVSDGGDNVLPTAGTQSESAFPPPIEHTPAPAQVTEEEKQNVKTLMEKLGL